MQVLAADRGNRMWRIRAGILLFIYTFIHLLYSFTFPTLHLHREIDDLSVNICHVYSYVVCLCLYEINYLRQVYKYTLPLLSLWLAMYCISDTQNTSTPSTLWLTYLRTG